jgi:hypothetical protein
VPLSWGFDTWSGCRELDRENPSLTVTGPCIWHDSGTNLSRRQPATTAVRPTDQARVCLVVPQPACAPSAWEAAITSCGAVAASSPGAADSSVRRTGWRGDAPWPLRAAGAVGH